MWKTPKLRTCDYEVQNSNYYKYIFQHFFWARTIINLFKYSVTRYEEFNVVQIFQYLLAVDREYSWWEFMVPVFSYVH